jgi:hypothetical protein
MSVPYGQGESGPVAEPRIGAEFVRPFEAFGDTWARIPGGRIGWIDALVYADKIA